MLRDKSLIPLSHQHQHALALCVRIDRAQPIPPANLKDWQAEIAQIFEQEITFHFAAEEAVVFPAARSFPELTPLVEELIAEHAVLRNSFSLAQGRCLSTQTLPEFGQRLSAHIRKEERQLFEPLQRFLTGPDLAALGVQLENALKEAAQSCVLPNESTKLRPQK